MRRFGVLLAGVLLCSQAYAGTPPLPGIPPYTRFAPNLNVFPQNFAVAEDRDSIVYVGNYDGVLSFDAERWRLIPMPNHELVRSLAYDGHRRVYVGGYDEFGYIDHDADGQPVFHDLVSAFKGVLKKPDFEDIWSVDVSPDGVFFVALRQVFLYEPGTGRVKAWRYPGRFGAIANYRGHALLQFRGRGLEEYLDGRWQPLPGGDGFKHLVDCLVPLGDGGLLALSADGSWRVYRDGRIRRFPVPKALPAASHFFAGKTLSDGMLALASDNGSLYFLSADGGHSSRIHLADGALSDLLVANDGGLLVIGDQALFHVQWPTAWTMVNETNGLSGTLHRVVEWGGNWYVLSGAGVYEALAGSSDRLLHFRHLGWSDHAAWDLLPLDRSRALLAESYAVMEIRGGKARAITNEHLYPRVLLRSRFDPDRIYVGTESGLAILIHSGGRWRLALDDEGMHGLRVSSMVEVAPGRLWLGSERGGVRLVQIGKRGRHVVGQTVFGPGNGLEYGSGLRGGDVALLPGGTLIASTAGGEYRWNGERFEADGLGGLERLRKPGRWLTIAARGNDMWAFGEDRVYHRAGKSRPWRAEPIGRIRHGAIQEIDLLGDGRAMLVTTDAILHYSPLEHVVHRLEPHVLLRAVKLTRPDGSQEFLPLRPGAHLRLAKDAGALTFDFALPDYTGHHAALYSARLADIESRFSPWAPNASYTYSQLRPADYAFYIRGRDSGGSITGTSPFRFSVLPEWYASDWARALWIALLALTALLVAGALVRFRTRKLAAEKGLLEAMVAERTAELEAANRRLETMAHLDGLTGIPNRRRMDDYLQQVWQQCVKRQRPLAVLVIDVDRFKDYNDRHGHLAGDLFLKRLTETLSHCLRRSEDFLARYGGEEFLVVLPGADAATALDLAEHMRAEVEAGQHGPTISLGVAAAVPTPELTIVKLMSRADRALYEAKTGGRNRVVAATG